MIANVILFILFTILNVIDVGQTRVIRKPDNDFYEVNPILKRVSVNVSSMLQIVSNVVVGLTFLIDNDVTVTSTLTIILLMKIFIVANNVRIGVKFPFKQGGQR